MPLDLTGEKVRLRALETRDLDAILAAYQDLDLQLTTDGDSLPAADKSESSERPSSPGME